MLSSEDHIAIEALHRAWLDAELRGDSLALLQLCDATPVWLPAGGAPLCGAAAITRWLASQPRTTVLQIDINECAISGVGTFASKLATFRTTVVGASGNPEIVTGSHGWLLQKTPATGTWRISVVAWMILENRGYAG